MKTAHPAVAAAVCRQLWRRRWREARANRVYFWEFGGGPADALAVLDARETIDKLLTPIYARSRIPF